MGHFILKIMKGVQVTPGDSDSAEQGLDEVDLLDPLGFSTDTYDMRIPALKSSAIYADSPITDGRTLIAGAFGNVTETIRATLTTGSIPQLSAMLSKLLRFKQDCNDFWETFGQIEPVYLKHQVEGEPGARYALLYDIDIAIGDPVDPSTPTRDITIVMEREFGWRGIAPGDNPKKWTAYKRSATFNAAYADLTAGDHLAQATVMNGNEYTDDLTFLSKNAVTIPAADIDGDLPALVCLSFEPAGFQSEFIAAVDSRPVTMPSTETGIQQLRRLNLIAAEANLVTDAAYVTDSACLRYIPNSANRRRIDVTFGTAADSNRAVWTNDIDDISTWRGRFAIFARVRQYSGAQGDLRYYITMNTQGTPDVFYTSPIITPTLHSTIAAGIAFPMDYLGIVTLPEQEKVYVQARGRGVLVSGSSDPTPTDNFLDVRLRASRVAGTTAQLAISDLVFMPIDQGCVRVQVADLNGENAFVAVDNTGYFTHGSQHAVSVARIITAGVDAVDKVVNTELSGNDLFLKPGVDNRIITMFSSDDRSFPALELDVYVDIVPRWSGLRDV